VNSLADVLSGLLSKSRWKGTMPRINCYCFMRSKETNGDIIKVGLASLILALTYLLNLLLSRGFHKYFSEFFRT
jgi:hypothetical protein